VSEAFYVVYRRGGPRFVFGDLKFVEQIFGVVFGDEIASADLLGRKQTFADPFANGGCTDTSFERTRFS
jgi:hypothetical protein